MDLFSNKEHKLVRLSEIEEGEASSRVSTSIAPLDRALGGILPDGSGEGGFVRGSVVLLGGEPGVGKSTLLLQILDSMAKQGKVCVYDSAEESTIQLKMATSRCKISSDFFVGNISVVEDLASIVSEQKADILVADSIQGFTSSGCENRAGSPTQLGVSCDSLIKFAKDSSIPLIIICQLTTDGGFRGPKALEHNVDVVGKLVHGDDPDHFRVLTFSKNRFGPTLIQNKFPWMQDFGRYDFSEEALKSLEVKEVEPAVAEVKVERVVPLNEVLRRQKKEPKVIPNSESHLRELAALQFNLYPNATVSMFISVLVMIRNQYEAHYRVSEDHHDLFKLKRDRMRQLLFRAIQDPGITLEDSSPVTILV